MLNVRFVSFNMNNIWQIHIKLMAIYIWTRQTRQKKAPRLFFKMNFFLSIFHSLSSPIIHPRDMEWIVCCVQILQQPYITFHISQLSLDELLSFSLQLKFSRKWLQDAWQSLSVLIIDWSAIGFFASVSNTWIDSRSIRKDSFKLTN